MDHAELLWKTLRQRQLRHEQESHRAQAVQMVNHATVKRSTLELQEAVKQLEQRVRTLEGLLMAGKVVG